MNQDSMRGLLHDGVPNPPLELMAPPLAGIRQRAHRRRLATGVGTAAALLVMAGVGVQVVQAAQTPSPLTPGAQPSATGTAGPWVFAVVGADDRSLTVVREGQGAGDPCPGTSFYAQMPTPGPVQAQADRVVLPLPILAAEANCIYRMSVRLDTPLGSRTLINGNDNSALQVLHERILPRPTYPTGISADTTDINIVGNAARPGWIVSYSRPDGLTITVFATPTAAAADLPVQERLKAHGHDMQILQFPPGKNNIVAWTAEGWQISVQVDPANHDAVTRTELQHIIDGLVWP